jgi:hypothetical protein
MFWLHDRCGALCLVDEMVSLCDFAWDGRYVNELMPPEYAPYKIAAGFVSIEPIPDQESELKKLLKDKGIAEIIVAPRIEAPWQKVRPGYTVYPPRDWTPMLSPLGIKPIQIGGVKLYRLKGAQI